MIMTVHYHKTAKKGKKYLKYPEKSITLNEMKLSLSKNKWIAKSIQTKWR